MSLTHPGKWSRHSEGGWCPRRQEQAPGQPVPAAAGGSGPSQGSCGHEVRGSTSQPTQGLNLRGQIVLGAQFQNDYQNEPD